MDNLIDCLKCPITHQIFYDPVIADDGYVYEKTVLEKLLIKYNKKSPFTRKEIKSHYSSITLKNLIDDIIKKNPEYAQFQYQHKIVDYPSSFQIVDIIDNPNLFDTFKRFNWSKLVHLTNDTFIKFMNLDMKTFSKLISVGFNLTNWKTGRESPLQKILMHKNHEFFLEKIYMLCDNCDLN